MKRSRIAVFAAIAAIGCVSLAVVAQAHTVRYSSEVTIRYHKNGQDPDSFLGEVTSERRRCVANRTVDLRQRTDGSSTLIGTATTNADGDWEVVLAGDAAEGTYFADLGRKVLRRNADHRHICRGDLSPNKVVH